MSREARVFMMVMVLAIASYLTGALIADFGFKNSAVKAGKAEYYLDAKNERQWRWKP